MPATSLNPQFLVSSIHPLFFLYFTHSFGQRVLLNSFGIWGDGYLGGYPLFLPNGLLPRSALAFSGRRLATKDFSFTLHQPAPIVSGSRVAIHCYFFLLHMGHNVTSHSATRDQKRCSMHGTTFLPGTTSRAIFKRSSRSPWAP